MRSARNFQNKYGILSTIALTAAVRSTGIGNTRVQPYCDTGRLDWIACISLNWYELQMDGSSISGDYFFLLSHFTRTFSQLWVQQLFFQIPAQFAFSIAFSERDGQRKIMQYAFI